MMQNNESKTPMSERDLWQTPQSFVDQVAEILKCQFVLDSAAVEATAKAPSWISPEEDGLAASWATLGGAGRRAVWCNPPFSQMEAWVKKAAQEAEKGVLVVMVHADVRERGWYKLAEELSSFQLLPNQRLQYLKPDGSRASGGVNFNSVVSVFAGFQFPGTPTIRFDIK